MTQILSKFDAAEEQLITAINLYFEGKNPISVYTLARASHEILDKICEHKGLDRSVIEQGKYLIKAERMDEFRFKINEARNFFKHADKDPEGSIEWNPEISMHFIWDATSLYRRITNEKMPNEIMSFSIWYRFENSALWDEASEFDVFLPEGKAILGGMDKTEAYKLLLQAARSI